MRWTEPCVCEKKHPTTSRTYSEAEGEGETAEDRVIDTVEIIIHAVVIGPIQSVADVAVIADHRGDQGVIEWRGQV